MKMGIKGKLAQNNVVCFSHSLKPDGVKAMWGGQGGQGGGWAGDAQEDKESRGQNGSAKFQGLKVKSVPSGGYQESQGVEGRGKWEAGNLEDSRDQRRLSDFMASLPQTEVDGFSTDVRKAPQKEGETLTELTEGGPGF